MSDTPSPPKSQRPAQPAPRADEARKARLAANLRANLKRRKAQARATDTADE
ncbi:hypothetical protein [Blastomonas sp.]|uniref:hypothetical protein n=1 Tax=Blastomonas sp. TaxID=1909299 RepID=UPI00261F794F|nr:hypothetical protein [Blastomonas sp.]MDM7957699.1 hypothetical protein [Blastomonas sp.]